METTKNATEETVETAEIPATTDNTKKAFKEKLKRNFKNSAAGKWMYANPKKFYFFAAAIILVSLVINTFLAYHDYDNRLKAGKSIPSMYQSSEEYIKQDQSRREQLEAIHKELDGFKQKRNAGIALTQADSLRIEFLYNQYQTLENAKK
jgi:hypothetical protein